MVTTYTLSGEIRKMTTVATSLNQDLPADDNRRLGRYLAGHLALKQGSETLPWTIERARLQSVRTDDAGMYTQLALFMTSHVPVSNNADAMTLHYDAIMHEVRNHRATVYWLSPDSNTSTIARFGYRPTDGRQQANEFKLPNE